MSDKKTVQDVLDEVRFQARLDELLLKLPATLVLANEQPSLARRNQVRRKFYRDSEVLRIEIEEQLNEYGIESEWLSSPLIADANKKLDEIRKQLRLDVLPTSGTTLEKVSTLVRFATLVLIFIGWFSAVCLLLPLRLLDKTLRDAGVSKNWLPIDIASWGMATLVSISGGSDIRAEGREHLTNLKDSVVCMFSHASNLDGFIVNSMSPVAFKYAAKKSLFMVPILGWASRWCLGFVPIDRSNRKAAQKSLKDLAQSVNVEGNSVSLSPEGTRSKDGLLQEFKKGPFYLRDDTGKNVVPAIVFGAYECWPPGRLMSSPAKTLVRFLPEFKPDTSKNRNMNRLALRRVFLDAFTEDVPHDIGSAADANAVAFNVLELYLIWAISFKAVSFALAVISWFCSVVGISYWTYTKLSLLVTVALETYMFFTC